PSCRPRPRAAPTCSPSAATTRRRAPSRRSATAISASRSASPPSCTSSWWRRCVRSARAGSCSISSQIPVGALAFRRSSRALEEKSAPESGGALPLLEFEAARVRFGANRTVDRVVERFGAVGRTLGARGLDEFVALPGQLADSLLNARTLVRLAVEELL